MATSADGARRQRGKLLCFVAYLALSLAGVAAGAQFAELPGGFRQILMIVGLFSSGVGTFALVELYGMVK